jgi:hypothetical protein
MSSTHDGKYVHDGTSVFRPTSLNLPSSIPPPSIREVKEAMDMASSLKRRSDRRDYMFSQCLDFDKVEDHLETVEMLERSLRKTPRASKHTNGSKNTNHSIQSIYKKITFAESYFYALNAVVLFMISCVFDDQKWKTDDR